MSAARESFLHSVGAPKTYALKTGGHVELRNGAVYRDNRELAPSSEAEAWLRSNCKLTDDEAYWLATTLKNNAVTPAPKTHVSWAPCQPAKHGSKFKEAE